MDVLREMNFSGLGIEVIRFVIDDVWFWFGISGYSGIGGDKR